MDSLTVSIDTLQPIETFAQDTSTVSIVGTTTVSVVDMPKENGPSPWLQLLLPLFIALLVVLLEKWVTRCYEHRDAKSARKRYRETILGWLKKIVPIEKVYSQSVRNLADAISKSDDLQPESYAMPLTIHDKLNDMTIEGMTEAFMHDFKTCKEVEDKRFAHVYNILSNIEFLSKISGSISQSYDSYNKQAFSYCTEWNAVYEAFISRYNALPEGNVYETLVKSWLLELIKQPNSVKLHLQYLEKLDEVAYQIHDDETLALISKMRHIAMQSQSLSKGYAIVFRNFADNIDLSLNFLTDAAEYLSE